MVKIVNAYGNDEYILTIEFSNGNKIIYNIKPKLNTVRFMPLRNIDTFKDITVENQTLKWWEDGECVVECMVDEIIINLKRL